MAFPTTPILDTFDRTNENPIAGIWAPAALTQEDDRLQVVSNVATGTNAAIFNSGYVASPVGAEVEAYFTIPAVSVGNRVEVYARVVDIDISLGTDAYCTSVAGTAWTLRIITNSSSVALGATHTGPSPAAGDGIGIKISGSILEAWHKPAAGSWTQLFTRTDSTWQAGGFIGARMFGTTYTMNDFGGGTISGSERLVVRHGIGMGRW